MDVATGKHLPCGRCGGPHRFDTSVQSVLWNQVIRPLGWSEYLCTSCILEAFARAGVSFTAELYGDGFHGLPVSFEVNGVASQAAALVQDQNNELRCALIGIAETAGAAMQRAYGERPAADAVARSVGDISE